MSEAIGVPDSSSSRAPTEIGFFFQLASERLRARCRWGGAVLALSLLVPYEIVDGRAQFVWQLLGELPAAAVVATLAPTGCGVAIAIGSRFARRATSLAALVLASLTTVALLIQLGADAAAWEVLPLPQSLTDRPTPALLALALTAAGTNLAFKPQARKAARVVLVAALLCAAFFYLWPARGEAPIATVGRALGQIGRLPSWRVALGVLILSLFALWPALMASLALWHAYRPPRRDQPILGALALHALPAMMLMLVYRSLLGAQGGAHVMAAIGGIAVLAALLGLVSSATEVLIEGLVSPETELGQPRGLAPRAAVAAGLAGALVLCGAEWALARPPPKGVEWTPGPPSPDGDRLFSEIVPAWSDARRTWDDQVRRASSASALVEVKGAARTMVDRANGLDPGLGLAFEDLARQADELDVAGRRFYRLVGAINEASRRARLPYYVDPTVALYQTSDGLRRHFSVHGYRIEQVRRFVAGKSPLAALHVRQLGEARTNHNRLGFSRDLQPFALVVLDEMEPYAKDLASLASMTPPRCGHGADAEAEAAFLRCGETLQKLVAELPMGLGGAITSTTERHELQHQLDGPHLPFASRVLARMAAYDEDSQRRVNRELSAYVAELTTVGTPPRLGLVHLLRFALTGRRSVEHHVGVLAFEALSGRSLDSAEALGASFLELTGMDDAALSARASAAWRELFGSRLPALQAP